MDPSTSVVPRPETAVAEPSVGELLHLAIEKGLQVDALEKLVALHERMADRRAAADFAAGLARFQQACPPIAKTATAEITTRGGSKFSYAYAPLDEIARTVAPLLHREGFSYTWDSDVIEGRLHCTCILRHVNGAEVRASFNAPMDTAGSMSETQKTAATLTYARRQSLISVLGLTTAEPDTDDAGSTEPISEEQRITLEDIIAATKTNLPKFLAYLKVESLAVLPAKDYGVALMALKQREAKQAAKAGA